MPGADGVGTTRLGGLLSRESLPDARLAFDQDELQRTVRFAPDPDALTWDSAAALAATVVTLKATSGSSSGLDELAAWETQLDTVLRDVRAQVSAASAQASVLLIGVLTAAVLVLLLAADLLVRRRAPALAAARQRGAALPDLGAELLHRVRRGGAGRPPRSGSRWPARSPRASPGLGVPVVLAAAVAGPAFGTLAAARATRDRRDPANRAARRWTRRTGQLRRAAAGGRGPDRRGRRLRRAAPARDPARPPPTATPVRAGRRRWPCPPARPPSARSPARSSCCGCCPSAPGLALRQALRSRRPLAVFGAARAAATAARALPLLVLVTSTALASFALILDATAGQGLADGAWRTVGADARLDVAADAAAATPALAERIAAAPGVRAGRRRAGDRPGAGHRRLDGRSPPAW